MAEEKKEKKIEYIDKEYTKKHFPTMMSKSRILILDFDMIRYHSFELFTYLLLDENYFRNVADFNFLKTFVSEAKDLNHKVLYYSRHVQSYNPYDLFKDDFHVTVNEMENRMNGLFPKLTRTIPTDLANYLGAVFSNKTVEGYLLKYRNDPVTPSYEHLLKKVYTTDHVLDLRMAIEIIRKHQINTIFISSVHVAMQLIGYLMKMKYPERMSFFIATYYYNYDPKTGLMKFLNIMNKVEYLTKYDFNTIDPFTGLNILRKYEKGEQV